MKLLIDTDARTLTCKNGADNVRVPLYSSRAFELVSAEWVRLGWNQKHTYTFSWMGRPATASDLMRVQDLVHRLRPDVTVETGIAHGGSGPLRGRCHLHSD